MLLTKQATLSRIPTIDSLHRTMSYANGSRYFGIPTVNICRLNISKNHKLSYTAERVFKDPGHVFHRLIRKRYQNVVNGKYDPREEGLWITCTSNTMPGTKAVRSWTTRKMRQAIVDALKSRGFDRKGKKLKTLAGTGQEIDDGHVLPELLSGTLSIETMPLIRETKYEEVQRQADMVVNEVVRICGQRWIPSTVKRPLLKHHNT
ncbi:hypothetical protein JMJ35_010233 [Cladonia borealis]|uniref:Uncharacterized protein n=1 Tax=Cladonia borealis TaxID=184061 RepID=A0AA39V602_9LECA|nr:hypothetical protein JMJ35_010233 [Cladonia borealis]